MKQRPDKPRIKPFKGPAGGWGSVRSLAEILPRERLPAEGLRELARQNKPDGFMCVSCAWPKPADHHPFEFCEEGGKATAWELTKLRTTPDFFARHTLRELRDWSDYELEQHGRLTHPLRYDAATDKYVACSWDEAFDDIAAALKPHDPKSVVFYSSGRTSLEASYMYGLMARMFGNQNLPDSSNMCHESTSVGLKSAIGVPVGTTRLQDFDHCDAIFFFGQNVGSNAPRMLHNLRDCRKRGVEIITFNPLKERGLERFTDPQNPVEMATLAETQISTQYHQVKAGGDIAAMLGIAKHLIAWDDAALAKEEPAVLDHDFIEAHTKDFDAFAEKVRETSWTEIEEECGLTRTALKEAARVYARSSAVMAIYGMGLTQHVKGVENVRMVVNLLLLRGNIGKPGAGPTPVRGHSNVQGQRTVGITEKTELVPVEKLEEQYGFTAPREKGLDTVETCRGVIDGSVKAVVALGGNFLRAVPETGPMEAAWPNLDVSVQIATKLNRNHLFAGKTTYLLPCLGRIETDVQATGPQAVSVEDSTSCIHGSRGKATPASPHLLSEPAIVAALAKRILAPNPKVDWDAWVADYDRIRDAIEETYPDIFKDFNARMFTPGGFWKGNKASERIWLTPSGKAEFLPPSDISATGFKAAAGRFRLVTLRSNDQFNTTIYGYHDRFRGIKGTRDVVLINKADMLENGLEEGQLIALESDADDGQKRRRDGFIVTPYDIPRGCLGAYYPEANVLIPVEHHAEESHVPAAKSVPVRDRALTTSTHHTFARIRSAGETTRVERPLAVEAPVALEFDGIGYAVLMATPADLIDLAFGFALSERLIDAADDIVDAEAHEVPAGWIVRVTLTARVANRVRDRVRHRTSDSACGLCGVESLEQALRPLPRVPAWAGETSAVFAAAAALAARQPLGRATRAVHGAARCKIDGAIVGVREDVGRHNAFDKLIGSIIRAGEIWDGGFALLSSRCSYELVEKAALAGCPMLATISAPTDLAVSRASEAGLALHVVVRSDALLAAS